MVDRHLRGLSDRTPNIFEDEFHEDDDVHDYIGRQEDQNFIDREDHFSVEQRFNPSFDKSEEPHEVAAFMVSASNQDYNNDDWNDDDEIGNQDLTDFNVGITQEGDFMRPSLMTVDLDYTNHNGYEESSPNR